MLLSPWYDQSHRGGLHQGWIHPSVYICYKCQWQSLQSIQLSNNFEEKEYIKRQVDRQVERPSVHAYTRQPFFHNVLFSHITRGKRKQVLQIWFKLHFKLRFWKGKNKTKRGEKCDFCQTSVDPSISWQMDQSEVLLPPPIINKSDHITWGSNNPLGCSKIPHWGWVFHLKGKIWWWCYV